MAYDEYGIRQRRLKELLAELEGLFDAVVVLGSFQVEETGETAMLREGMGNWYAQNGMAEYFLTKRREDPKIEARKQSEEG